MSDYENKDSYNIHESSIVEDDVFIGEGVRIGAFCHIYKKSFIGKNCQIGDHVVIGPDATVAERCQIEKNVIVAQGVYLDEEVFCGSSVVFTDVINPRSTARGHNKKTKVKKGATIGANATIMCGITIGKNAFIGPCCVVIKDVPDDAVVEGEPAKIVMAGD